MSNSYNRKLEYNTLFDVVRSSVRLNTIQNLYYALHKLRDSKKWFNRDIRIIRIINNFTDDKSLEKNLFGYRRIVLQILIEDRDYPQYICELQLNHNLYQQLRMSGFAYSNYMSTRFLIDFVLLVADESVNRNRKLCNGKVKQKERDEILSSVQKLLYI